MTKIHLKGYDDLEKHVLDYTKGLELSCPSALGEDTSYAFCQLGLIPPK